MFIYPIVLIRLKQISRILTENWPSTQQDDILLYITTILNGELDDEMTMDNKICFVLETRNLAVETWPNPIKCFSGSQPVLWIKSKKKKPATSEM